MLYYFCTCFRAVASPAKLSCTQRTRVNNFSWWWLCRFSCLHGLFDFSQNLVSWYSENFICFCFQVRVMSGWVSWLFWQSVALISENLNSCWQLRIYDKILVLCLCFIPVREDLQNFDELIALIDGEKSALLGNIALSLISFSVSERNLSLVNNGCPCCIYTWGV